MVSNKSTALSGNFILEDDTDVMILYYSGLGSATIKNKNNNEAPRSWGTQAFLLPHPEHWF